MNNENNMNALFIIVKAGYADEVIQTARNAGATGATILNTRGEGKSHEVFMGITVDSEQEMILCVLRETDAVNVMAAIKEQSGVNTPAHSICFTMPVNKVVGIETSAQPEQG